MLCLICFNLLDDINEACSDYLSCFPTGNAEDMEKSVDSEDMEPLSATETEEPDHETGEWRKTSNVFQPFIVTLDRKEWNKICPCHDPVL